MTDDAVQSSASEGATDISRDPVCLYCDNHLKRLWWGALKRVPANPAEPNGLQRMVHYRPKVGEPYEERGSVLAVKRDRGWKEERYLIFAGDFVNYGTDSHPFCKRKCAAAFGLAAARAGYRMKKKPPIGS